MDENGSMNYRTWGFYEPPAVMRGGGYLGLQLMPSGQEKPNPGGRSQPAMMNTNNIGPFHHMPMHGGPFHHNRIGGVSGSPMPVDFIRDSWTNVTNPRDKYFGGVSSNQHHHSSFSLLPETSGGQDLQMLQPNHSPNDEEGITQSEEIDIESHSQKRPGGKIQKSPKAKKPKKAGRAPRDDGRVAKKSVEMVINGVDMDISSIPIPVCSCTGAPQQCYRWGSGGWQSACCTTGMSVYPLPMSTKRRGARIAGRKMSIGAFKKVLEKLASEGYNFSQPIDLRTHWAKHGTNKFVTIR